MQHACLVSCWCLVLRNTRAVCCCVCWVCWVCCVCWCACAAGCGAPVQTTHSRTDCTRTRGANSRARARAGLLTLLHTGCTRTRRANSRARARAGSLSHTSAALARGERTVASASVQAPPSLSHTHQEDHPFRGRSAEHCRKSPPSLLSHSHTYCHARGERTVAPAPVQGLSLSYTPAARARGGRTVAPASVQAFSLAHLLHAHAESEQSRPRPCRLPTLTQAARARGERTVASASLQALSLSHRLHARAGSEQSHPRPCRASLSRADYTHTRRANSRTRVRAVLLTPVRPVSDVHRSIIGAVNP